MLQSQKQRAKKVVSDSLGLVDFAIGPLNSVFYLPNGQVIFLGNSNYGIINQSCSSKYFFQTC